MTCVKDWQPGVQKKARSVPLTLSPPVLPVEAFGPTRRGEATTDFSAATAMAYSSSPADTTTTTLATDVVASPTSHHITATISLASTTGAVSPPRRTASAPQSQPLSLAMRSQFVKQHHQHHHRQRPLQHASNQQHNFTGAPQNPIQTQTTVLYPLASSGRGLLPSTRPQLAEQRVTVANPSVYSLSARSIEAAYHPPPPQPQHELTRLFASSDSSQPPHSSYPLRTFCLHPSHGQMSSVSFPTAGAGIRGTSVSSYAQPKVASFPCLAPGSNGHEESMDKVTDDLFVSVKDRKVRISDGASIYALCRSWLRNGYSEESQLQYGDFMKSLPKPSPMPMSESSPVKRKENDDETEIKEDENKIENLSAKELLKRHIQRAKRVRARFREERLQRIARYKSRLALLLPPVMEQCVNDTSTGT